MVRTTNTNGLRAIIRHNVIKALDKLELSTKKYTEILHLAEEYINNASIDDLKRKGIVKMLTALDVQTGGMKRDRDEENEGNDEEKKKRMTKQPVNTTSKPASKLQEPKGKQIDNYSRRRPDDADVLTEMIKEPSEVNRSVPTSPAIMPRYQTSRQSRGIISRLIHKQPSQEETVTGQQIDPHHPSKSPMQHESVIKHQLYKSQKREIEQHKKETALRSTIEQAQQRNIIRQDIRKDKLKANKEEAQRARQQAKADYDETMEMERLQQKIDRLNIPSEVERDILTKRKTPLTPVETQRLSMKPNSEDVQRVQQLRTRHIPPIQRETQPKRFMSPIEEADIEDREIDERIAKRAHQKKKQNEELLGKLKLALDEKKGKVKVEEYLTPKEQKMAMFMAQILANAQIGYADQEVNHNPNPEASSSSSITPESDQAHRQYLETRRKRDGK